MINRVGTNISLHCKWLHPVFTLVLLAQVIAATGNALAKDSTSIFVPNPGATFLLLPTPRGFWTLGCQANKRDPTHLWKINHAGTKARRLSKSLIIKELTRRAVQPANGSRSAGAKRFKRFIPTVKRACRKASAVPKTTFYISATASAGGRIEPSGQIEVLKGESQTFSFLPDNAHVLRFIEVDSIRLSAPSELSYDFSNVTGNHSIHAEFATVPAAIIVNTGLDLEITQPDLAELSANIVLANPGSETGLRLSWEEINGPGVVVFHDRTALSTSASFSSPGAYLIRLEASLDGFSVNDELSVTVHPKPPLPVGGTQEGAVECNGIDDNLDGIIDNWCQITDRTWPAEYGQAELTLWKDDKLGAVSITIDDNTAPDHAWWLETGQLYGYKFTWFVVTANLELGGYWGTWDSFRTLLEAGHDIQSHTVTHNGGSYTIEEEYELSKQQIEAHYPGHKVLTLAYPGSGSVANDVEVAKRFYLGARGVVGHHNMANRIDYMQTKSFAAFQYETDHWASIVNIINYNPRQPRSYRAWECKHFHQIGAIKDTVRAGLDYIKAHESDFWVALFQEVILFGQERDTAEVLVDYIDKDRIELRLTDMRDDTNFDYPLTIKVKLDDSWQNASAVQAEQEMALRLVEHLGETYALLDVIPDRGTVRLSKQ